MANVRARGTYRRNSGNKKMIIIVVCVIIAVVVGIFGFTALSEKWEKSKYPLEYEDLIEEYASLYELDPYFVAAVINTESGFRADAVSSAGATGLMQLMPETAEWIAGKLDDKNLDAQNLTDPQTNIEMGCWYLNFLKERFDSNLPVMMAAYNAGHNKVKSWLEDAQYSSDGKNLTSIPYPETENYVKKVTKAYDEYKKRYELG